MEILNDTALVVLSMLGLLLIVIGLVIPYFIYQINCEIKELRKEIKMLSSSEPQEADSRPPWWKKSGFTKK